MDGSLLSRGGREQAQCSGVLDGLTAAVDSELGVEVARVRLDGVDRYVELVGDLLH